MKNLGAEHENLDQKAYEIVKNMITERQILPGEKIPQEKLAQELGISRTPLVNALKYLEKEKLVTARPRRGFFVRLFTREEMISIFELREVLEGLAARRAAEGIGHRDIDKLRRYFHAFDGSAPITDIGTYAREDREFHSFVTELGSREFLKSVLRSFNIITFSYQLASSEGLVRNPEDTLQEHKAIISAISDRDPAAAERLMRRHFQKAIHILKTDTE